MNTLVSTEELAAHLEWRVFDCRHDLANPDLGEQQYREGHIPGARFAHLERDLSAPKTGKNGRHPLPEPKAFVSWLGKQGLQPTDQVACYDGGPGAMAARLWWMLRWAGHETVAVLDGGLAKWQRDGRPVTTDVPEIVPLAYPGRAKTTMVAYLSHVEKKLKKAALLDARAPARYRGEQEPIDPVAGRIPGAKHLYFEDLLDDNKAFKPAQELQQLVEARGAAPHTDIITYCRMSHRATVLYFVLTQLLGYKKVRIYDGSWTEWGNLVDVPIER